MKIKITWGTGLLITIIVFVSFFLSFLFFSLTQDVNLVSKDYYPDEIAYETKLQKIKNTNLLKEKITLEKKDDKIIIYFPKMKGNSIITGHINFYYIKNYRYDAKFKIETNSNLRQIFFVEKLKKGRYNIMIDWSFNNQNYFQEFKITL